MWPIWGSRARVRALLIAALAIVMALLAGSASASALTIVNAPHTLSAGASGSIRFNAGSSSRTCEFLARSGRRRLGPLRYSVSKPIVLITGRVPSTARAATWTISLRCSSSRARLARAANKTARIRVIGSKRGRLALFAARSLHALDLAASTVVGAQEPEQLIGGKGGYVCASAWDGYRSVLDASTYCTGYCTWFVWQKRPEQQLKDLGNADEWYERAKAKGIPVGSTPVVGAVATWGVSAHAPEGHVAYVIAVNGSTITIEEMNRTAWDVSDTRVVAGGELPNGYIYGGPAGNRPGSSGGGTSPGGGSGATTGGPSGTNDYQLAFQANTNELIAFGADATSNTGQGMMPGTSPSVAALAGGGYEMAFQANTGNLIVFGTGGDINTGQGMKAGTSPSIAASPAGGFEVAFQANTGNLYVFNSSSGPANLQQGMDNETSPGIAS
jgi:surface antigen